MVPPEALMMGDVSVVPPSVSTRMPVTRSHAAAVLRVYHDTPSSVTAGAFGEVSSKLMDGTPSCTPLLAQSVPLFPSSALLHCATWLLEPPLVLLH